MPLSKNKDTKALTEAQKRMIRNRNRALARAVIQALFFVTMPGAFVAGFNGIKFIFRQMGSGSILENNSFLMALAGLGIFTVLFGRFFCGYACSFGALGDFVYWISGLFQKKLLKRKKRAAIPQKALPVLQKLKYLNLIFIVIMTTLGRMSSLKGTSPWDVFSQLTALRLPDRSFLVGILCFAGIVIGMAVQSRFFCQFLCPMGAFFAILPALPFTVLRRNPDHCLKGCSACRMMCPVSLKLEPDGIRNGECISCEKCTGVCPVKNIRYPLEAFYKKEIVYVLVRTAVFFAMGAWIGFCRFL